MLAELLQDQPNPTIDTIRQYISIHDTGVNILCAPTSPEFSEKIISSQIERIIVALRNYYDFVLVDTWNTRVGEGGRALSGDERQRMERTKNAVSSK